MCDTEQWRLDARPSRYLWETPTERLVTTLVVLLLPAVVLTWAPGVAWDVPITCCGNRPLVFKRAVRLLVTFLYASSHLLYVLLPEDDIPRSSAASITNASITSVAAFASMMACLNPDVFSSALVWLASLCTKSSASSSDVEKLVDRATSGSSSADEPAGCVEWIDQALGWRPTGREECYQVILSILSCLGFCAALASDVHVRDSTLAYGLGYTAVSILVVYFCAAVCHHGPRKAQREVQGQDQGRDPPPKKRCACIRNLPPFTKWALAVSALVVGLATPVLVLRPCASY